MEGCHAWLYWHLSHLIFRFSLFLSTHQIKTNSLMKKIYGNLHLSNMRLSPNQVCWCSQWELLFPDSLKISCCAVHKSLWPQYLNRIDETISMTLPRSFCTVYHIPGSPTQCLPRNASVFWLFSPFVFSLFKLQQNSLELWQNISTDPCCCRS